MISMTCQENFSYPISYSSAKTLQILHLKLFYFVKRLLFFTVFLKSLKEIMN